MFTSERAAVIAIGAVALAACVGLPSATGKPPAFGTAVSAKEIARWDISIPPSGAGLPGGGGGSARQGLKVYEEKCQSCHGAKGAGKPADPLAGGIGSLGGRTPLRTVGSYWPYATTLFDYVRRAMPIANPLSLTDDEVYAVSAYVLFLNGIVGEDAVMNAQTLPQVKMPNRDGFVSDWPPRARN
jgi:S-disulfanyl-L-cysteine oxidoreductase SoxD